MSTLTNYTDQSIATGNLTHLPGSFTTSNTHNTGSLWDQIDPHSIVMNTSFASKAKVRLRFQFRNISVRHTWSCYYCSVSKLHSNTISIISIYSGTPHIDNKPTIRLPHVYVLNAHWQRKCYNEQTKQQHAAFRVALETSPYQNAVLYEGFLKAQYRLNDLRYRCTFEHMHYWPIL